MSPTRRTEEHRGWPDYLLWGRIRTSTIVLIVAFLGTWWLYETYAPPEVPPESTQVVPPGFVPDPAYTWVPRTKVATPPALNPATTTPITTTTTATETTSPTESPEPGETPTPTPTSPVPATPTPSAPAPTPTTLAPGVPPQTTVENRSGVPTATTPVAPAPSPQTTPPQQPD